MLQFPREKYTKTKRMSDVMRATQRRNVLEGEVLAVTLLFEEVQRGALIPIRPEAKAKFPKPYRALGQSI